MPQKVSHRGRADRHRKVAPGTQFVQNIRTRNDAGWQEGGTSRKWRSYREIASGHRHDPLTHCRVNHATIEKVALINSYYVKQVAGLIEKLKAIRERDGTRHSDEDLGFLIAGKSGGSLKPGRLSNMFLTRMEVIGVPVEHLGDGTGRLEGMDLA